MIETCQCVIRVSVYVPCGRYHRWYQVEKLSVQKAKSVKKIFWPPRIDLFLPKFHCGCTDWKQKRALLWLSPLLSSNSNLLFALSNISKGGHSFSNAGPFSAIVVFSPIDYVLKGRSHDFYKKYYLEIESNLFAYLQFPLGVVKVHQLWSQTINMCNKKLIGVQIGRAAWKCLHDCQKIFPRSLKSKSFLMFLFSSVTRLCFVNDLHVWVDINTWSFWLVQRFCQIVILSNLFDHILS